MERDTEVGYQRRQESAAISCEEWMVDPPVTLVIHMKREMNAATNGFDSIRWMEMDRGEDSFESVRERVF